MKRIGGTYGETSVREDETKPGHGEVESAATYARIMCAYRHYEEKDGESGAEGISKVTSSQQCIVNSPPKPDTHPIGDNQ